MSLPEIGATNLSFVSFFLSFDDYESLVVSSSSESSPAIFNFYLVLLKHYALVGLFFCDFIILQRYYKGFIGFNIFTFNIKFF